MTLTKEEIEEFADCIHKNEVLGETSSSIMKKLAYFDYKATFEQVQQAVRMAHGAKN